MSEDLVYIPQNLNKSEDQDYEFLRTKGLEHIEKLSRKIWTDYNVHDPGITILEILCYALTDLGYRTSFDIEDILADGGNEEINNFFSARQILSCNPVTVNDFRKLMIDVEGVKNAWISLTDTQFPQIYADYKKSELTTKYDSQHEPLNLKGLFDIKLELDESDVFGDLNDFAWEIRINDKIEATLTFPGWSSWLEYGLDSEKLPDYEYQFDFLEFSSDRRSASLKFLISTDDKKINLGSTLRFREKTIVDPGEILLTLESQEVEEVTRQYFLRLGKALEVVHSVRKKLHTVRSLCEDYAQVEEIEIEDIQLCVDIEVEPEAEMERILTQIYKEVGNFLAPEIPFYTLAEMLDQQIRVEDIFLGPALNHGFIKDNDLEKTVLKTELNTSDLIHLIMDIEGVIAIKDIQIASSYRGNPINPGEKWSLSITPGRALRLDLPNSKIKFFKGLIPYVAFDERKIEGYLNEQRALKRSSKQGYGDHDLAAPQGSNYQLSTYTSIQEEFPLNYGIGKFGIPGSVNEKRKAQAYQLKGYLLILDQLLANYLSQLSHVKDILSMRSDVSRMSFYQTLYPSGDPSSSVNDELPNIDKLLAAFNQEVEDWESFKNNSENGFVRNLKALTENQSDFLIRRNRILDHLMARFNEKFADYVLLSYQLSGSRTLQELVADKEKFLQEYPTLSHDRGKAFNYCLPDELWDSDNVSGLEKRLARITGIHSFNRIQLGSTDAEKMFYRYRDKAREWRFTFLDKEGNKLLLSEGYKKPAGMENGIDSVLKNGTDESNYELRKTTRERHYYVLKAQNGEIIGQSGQIASEPQLKKNLQRLIALLQMDRNEEGFHLVEHLLLRPREEDDPLMPVCIEPGCKCPGCADPYSFRMTLVLPAWVDRFSKLEFRRFFEQTVRLETPAHLHVKICWLNRKDMQVFEEQYRAWLEENAKPFHEQTNRQSILLSFINTLNAIKSVYPEATLHDCEESDDNPVLLGHTSLGSTKTISS